MKLWGAGSLEIDLKSNMNSLSKKLSNAILGLAVADAVGVPYEFLPREDIARNPATNMTEYGTHHQLKGTWSDDTSMTLALIDALTKSGEEIDYKLIADNFVDWMQNAVFTAYNEVFDIGGTCFRAIRRHIENPDLPAWECGEKSEHACGNGGLMRILPLAFRLVCKYGENFINVPQAREEICRVTAITHANACCALANLIYVTFAGQLISGQNKKTSWDYAMEKIGSVIAADPWLKTAKHSFSRLLSDGFLQTPREELSSSGYVVHTLESAVWCFMNTQDYRSCVLAAVNLGEDTDTTAAVAGGLAGLYYRDSEKFGIPQSWVGALAKREEICRMCEAFEALFLCALADPSHF